MHSFPQLMVMVGMVVSMTAVLVSMIAVVVSVIMTVIVMVDALARPWPTRILAEYQRFDGHRHRVRRHADAPKVNVVEIPQHHPVDHQDLASTRFSSHRIAPKV